MTLPMPLRSDILFADNSHFGARGMGPPKCPFRKRSMPFSWRLEIFWRSTNVCSWLVLRSLFRPGQGTHQRPFCLANSLGIAPKILFANKMMTTISPYMALYPGRNDLRMARHERCIITSNCQLYIVNFHSCVCAVGNLNAIYMRDCCYHFVSDAQRVCQAERSLLSLLGRDETSCVRLATNNVLYTSNCQLFCQRIFLY